MSKRKYVMPYTDQVPTVAETIEPEIETGEVNPAISCVVKAVAGGKAYFEHLLYGFAVPSESLRPGDMISVRFYGALGTPDFRYEVVK